MKYFIYRRKSQEAEDRQIMSLESQADEIERLITLNPDIEIVGNYEESKTAKTPGRPMFNEMMDRIDKGEAQGIISWHPDRLARNSIDGGRVIYALDQGTLKNMKFCSYAFDNDPQGKFMLNIIFGYSKYYVDNLSINVKRGMQTKLKNGWKPNLAPIGYRNCKETKTIIPDKEHFEAIRGMFNLVLSSKKTPSDIHRIVCDEWQYKTPLRKHTGGKQPAISTIYKILANPFYAGLIRWNGQIYTGNHIPVITKQEYENVQQILGNTNITRKKSLTFPYTGMFKCGACGLSITAEKKTKPSGKQYTYYHCTRRHSKPYCTQPAINSVDLDKQIEQFLDRVSIPEPIVEWFTKVLNSSKGNIAEQEAENARKKQKVATALERQISNLTDLRTQDLISHEEYTTKRADLKIQLATAKEAAENSMKHTKGLEPIHMLCMLSARAKYWYSVANDEKKKSLLNILSYNPTLCDRKALLVAKKPFQEIKKIMDFHVCAGTCRMSELQRAGIVPATTKQIKKLTTLNYDQEIIALARQAEHFINQLDPIALADLRHQVIDENRKNIGKTQTG